MPISLTKGQRIDICAERDSAKQLLVGFGWLASNDIEIDAAAFLLDANGKTARDEDFVFYGNPNHPSGSVHHVGNGASDNAQISVNLGKIPLDVVRIAFTMTIYEPFSRRHNFGKVKSTYIRVADLSGREILRFNFGEKFALETAIVAGEIYRRNGKWKFNAVGSGFSGGLAALCADFGIEVKDAPPEPPPKPVTAQNARRDTPLPNPPPQPQEIELAKGQKFALAKIAEQGNGEICVTLIWNPQKNTREDFLGGFFDEPNNSVDLDLGCLLEMSDGRVGCIQALGGNLGNYYDSPYIELDGDDRTCGTPGIETLRIDGTKSSFIKRILVYTFIYDDAINWREANAVVTVKSPSSPEVIIRVDEYGSAKKTCALAMLTTNGDGSFTVEKLVRFFVGHREMDKAYGFGLKWVTGRKV